MIKIATFITARLASLRGREVYVAIEHTPEGDHMVITREGLDYLDGDGWYLVASYHWGLAT